LMSSSSSSSQQQAGDMGGDGDCPSSSSNCSAPSPPQLKLYQAFIFVTPIVFTIVLLLLFCCLYIRRRRQHMRATTQIRAQFFTRGLFSAVRSIFFPFFFPPLFYTLLLYFCVSVEIAANFNCRSKLEQNRRSSSIYNIVFKDHRNYCLMIFFLILHLHSKTKNYCLMIIFKLILHLHSNTQKKFNDFFHVDSASAFRNSLKYFHCGWGGEWVQPLEQGLNKSFRDGLPVLVYNEAFATSRDDTQ
jgi:hypothetical protein